MKYPEPSSPAPQAPNSLPARLFVRFLLLVTLLLNAAALYVSQDVLSQKGVLAYLRIPHAQTIITGLGIAALVVTAVLLILTWIPWRGRPSLFFQILEGLTHLLKKLGALNLALAGICSALSAYLVFGPFGEQIGILVLRSFWFWLALLAGTVFVKAWGGLQEKALPTGWIACLSVSLLLNTVIYVTGAYVSDISTYPFTLDWSEASRYYYASLFFSERIYGFQVSPTVLHPSRYLMQAVPFLIPSSPLWLHRAWQVFLWLGCSWLTAWLLARRLKIGASQARPLIVAWFFLFILLGPVYYHLQVPLILVLWGYRPWQGEESSRPRERIISIGAILLASLWAGISRVNWFPVPGLLAAILYFLEQPVGIGPANNQAKQPSFTLLYKALLPGRGSAWPYLLPPVAWTLVGTAGAFAAQALYIAWSGNKAGEFATSLTSDLLWYRLWPSPTYPPGILPAALLVSLPLLLLAAYRLVQRQDGISAWRRYHPVRFLGLGVILLVLFAGGLVVSVKIGGGSNLHNMDAYLSLLLVLCASFFFEQAVPDVGTQKIENRPALALAFPAANPSWLRSSGLALALILPSLLFVLSGGPSPALPDPDQIAKGMEVTLRIVDEMTKKGGEVLFISNRQLIIFDEVQGVRLVPEYERVFLMEMAMAGNPEYLERFYNDLKNHRFALIISEPLYIQSKGSETRFGEENDAWVQQITIPILQYYDQRRTLPAVKMEFLVPKESNQ